MRRGVSSGASRIAWRNASSCADIVPPAAWKRVGGHSRDSLRRGPARRLQRILPCLLSIRTQHMARLLLLSLALLALPLIAAEPRGAGKGDRERLQGTWYVVSMVEDGKKVPKESLKKMQLIFEGTHYALKGGKEEYRGKFTLTQDTSPRR